ncbi:glycerate kinase, partial [Burkholderia pseudomallei]
MSAPVAARCTRGLGSAIRALLDDGVRRFYVALGGSSTNDAGAGLVDGLGMRAFDALCLEIEPRRARLGLVAPVDFAW